MRRSLGLAAAIAAVLAVPAQAQTGGAEYVPLSTAFRVSPRSIAPGAELTIRYRIVGGTPLVRVRVDLLPEAGGPPAATLQLGRRPSGRKLKATWHPQLAAGRYTARLRVTTLNRGIRARASRRRVVEIVGAPVVASSGVFPIQGPYSFGGDEARFGAARPGHAHRGQDILAAAGTPVVAPRAGFVAWRAYQRDGAGHYVVLHGDDGRDYVFMHFLDGSVLVEKGQALAAGQQIAAVGSTGRSTGPHLHFEIWPGGWYAEGSAPIDPLPDLRAWADG